jgi:hypothetical protein
MRQVLPVVPAKHNPHYLIFKSCNSWWWLKQARPWMLVNLKIICQFHAHSVHQNSVEIYWAEIYRVRIFFRAEIYRGRLLTLITGSSSRLLRIRFSADLTMDWFPVCRFRCMKFKPLVIWIWNQNIAISTIVGTKDFNAETNTSLKLNLFSFFICGCQHHQRKTIYLYVYISDIRQIVGYWTPVFIQRIPWRLHITITYNLPHLQLWYADVITVIA